MLRELERKPPAACGRNSQKTLRCIGACWLNSRRIGTKFTPLHEPQVYCLAKGKEHKKYEFGSKASVVLTKTGGVIVGAVAHPENLYDGDALVPALEQTQAVTGQSADARNRLLAPIGFRRYFVRRERRR